MLWCMGIHFVRRFGEFINTNQPRGIYRRDLHLAHTYAVNILGVGGRTVVNAIRFDLSAISSTVPNAELSFNDICEQDSDADAIASELAALAELAVSVCTIQFIVVFEILPRTRPPFEEYNDRVCQIHTS